MENIDVNIRVRPLNDREIREGEQPMWRIANNEIIVKNDELKKLQSNSSDVRMPTFGTSQSFLFNNCFGPDSTSKDIYDRVAEKVGDAALEGYNGTIFAYGQTGSGKTFTMMGSNSLDLKKTTSLNETSVHQSYVSSNSFKQDVPILTKKLTISNISKSPRSKSPQTPLPGNSNFSKRRIIDNQKKTPIKQTRDESPICRKVDAPQAEVPVNDYTLGESSQEEYDGIMTYTMKSILNKIINNSTRKYYLRCSYLEIYNDNIHDLLLDNLNIEDNLVSQQLYEDGTKEFQVLNATEEFIHTLDDVLEIIKKGELNRHFASTKLNHTSSRSHTLFRLYIKSIADNIIDTTQDISAQLANETIMESILNFVDLAGSERASIHDDHDMPKKKSLVNETKHINKSLFWLNRIINLKSEGTQEKFIPYRNSPQTKILRSSIGNNAKTSIILCLSPTYKDFEQTMSTVRFGCKAKKIQMNCKKNVILNNEDSIRKIVEEYEKKIKEQSEIDVTVQNKSLDNGTHTNLMKRIKQLEGEKKNLHKKLLNVQKLDQIREQQKNLQGKMIKLYGDQSIADLTNNVKRIKMKTLHSNFAGVLETTTCNEDPNKSDEIKNIEKSDLSYLMKETVVNSLKSSLVKTEKRLKGNESDLKRAEDQSQNLIKIISNMENDIQNLRSKNKELTNLTKKLKLENGSFESLVKFFLNMSPNVCKNLSTQVIEKLTSNSMMLLDNLKSQKCINKFTQIVSFNNSFDTIESKKLLCDQMNANIGYEQNKDGEHIQKKLMDIYDTIRKQSNYEFDMKNIANSYDLESNFTATKTSETNVFSNLCNMGTNLDGVASDKHTEAKCIEQPRFNELSIDAGLNQITGSSTNIQVSKNDSAHKENTHQNMMSGNSKLHRTKSEVHRNFLPNDFDEKNYSNNGSGNQNTPNTVDSKLGSEIQSSSVENFLVGDPQSRPITYNKRISSTKQDKQSKFNDESGMSNNVQKKKMSNGGLQFTDYSSLKDHYYGSNKNAIELEIQKENYTSSPDYDVCMKKATKQNSKETFGCPISSSRKQLNVDCNNAYNNQ